MSATVDSAIGDIDIKQGTLSFELATTSVGNPANTVTVEPGATLQVYNLAVGFNKVVVLNGTGTNTTINNGSATTAVLGPVSLNGTVIMNAGGTELAFNNSVSNGVSGLANVVKTGTATSASPGDMTYTGTTTVSNGTFVIDGNKTGGAGIDVEAGFLGGGGTINSENVTINNAGFAPGGNTPQGVLTINGNVTMNGGTNRFELSPSPLAFGANDEVIINGNLSMPATNYFVIVVLNYLTVGDTYTLIDYSTGSNVDTNHVQARGSVRLRVLDDQYEYLRN